MEPAASPGGACGPKQITMRDPCPLQSDADRMPNLILILCNCREYQRRATEKVKHTMTKKKANAPVVENNDAHIGENVNENVVGMIDLPTEFNEPDLTGTTVIVLDDAELTAVTDALDAVDLVSAPTTETEDNSDLPPVVLDDETEEEAAVLTLVEAVASVTEEQRAEKLEEINAAFDDRVTFETMADPGNTNIIKNLKSYRQKMALPGIAGLMIATNVDADFMNRSLTSGKRFNVYGIDKLNDLLHGLNSGHFKNAINIAVMKSMFKFRAAGVKFTGLAALAAASDKVKVEKGMAGILVRHTVSASTAPTQSSSTMSALSVIGAVRNTGSVKFPIWELTDAPVTKRLEELLAA